MTQKKTIYTPADNQRAKTLEEKAQDCASRETDKILSSSPCFAKGGDLKDYFLLRRTLVSHFLKGVESAKLLCHNQQSVKTEKQTEQKIIMAAVLSVIAMITSVVALIVSVFNN